MVKSIFHVESNIHLVVYTLASQFSVFFSPCVICQQGSLGNAIVLPIELLKTKPHSLSFEEAATIPYTLMHVWDILVTQGELIPYKKANTRTKVLICGGLRPTEMLALQLSK